MFNPLRLLSYRIGSWKCSADEPLRYTVEHPLSGTGRGPGGGVSSTREQALPAQVDRIIDRAVAEAGTAVSGVVTASFILAGMHQEDAFLRAIFNRGLTMIESSAFKVIEDLAKEKHGREIVEKLATAQFGPPTAEQAAKLAAIDNLPKLDRLALRVLKVNSWAALLKGR